MMRHITLLNAFFNQCVDESTVKIVLKEVDPGKEAEVRAALFMREGSASEVRKRRAEANLTGHGALGPQMANPLANQVRSYLHKFSGLIKEFPYRKEWLGKICSTMQGRKFLSSTTPQVMQAHLRGRAKIQKGMGEHTPKVKEYRKDVNAWHKATFEGHTAFKADVVGLAKRRVLKSQMHLNALNTEFAEVFLEAFKSKSDPKYIESLQRFRVILASIAKFHNDFIFEYTVKLVTAQGAMAVFHEANPDYDAEDDEDDELGSAIYDQKFTTPSSIVAPRGADTMWPPCEGASEDGDLE
ncbi:hypothetical protein M885DRAFT_626722 [Pelagophyceae sp. CCMP2097]|nr:hypothetical protein M885DRAFT_626722 [Pelagophyceae sp. CCMP2097]